MRPLVLLFDIDGTLITTGGAGRRAMESAFALRHGAPDACKGFSFAGMTDRAIVRAGLIAIGKPATEAEIDATLGAYLERLAEEVRAATGYRVHAGIDRALGAAAARERCALGLGTGNVREGARLKLSRVGIFERFRFGGFGCDHEDRAELLRVGRDRGAALLGVPPSECRVVVIGDTPKDIAAARAIDAESFAVASGTYGISELAAFTPTRVFRDLDEPGCLDALFG